MSRADRSAWFARRRGIVLAFWSTIILGIPIWYLTTRVSRATLPLIPEFQPIRPSVLLDIKGLHENSAHKIIDGLNQLQNVHHFLGASSKTAYQIVWQESSEFHSELVPDKRQWNIRTTEAQSHNLEESIIGFILRLFSDERQRIGSVLEPELSPPDLKVVKYSPNYNLVFSLLNGGGGDHSIKRWSISAALDRIIEPILKDITSVATFSVESQIQYYADLTFDPVFDTDTGDYVLQQTDLKNFINSAEWNLATAQSQSKPLNFIIYVPKPEHRPLVIRDGNDTSPTNSFILPQFGSIAIYNPPKESDSDTMSTAALDKLITTCGTHFLELLGLPEIPPTSGDGSRWRRDGLLRHRLVETMNSAQQTLQSIPTLVNQIPNMHVPVQVSDLVSDSIDSLHRARLEMNIGHHEDALRSSRLAIKQAEEAFFNDKMISLLYFPNEHKYGVYMPLFGPLLLPLIMAAIRELKFEITVRKSRKKRLERHEHVE